MESGGLESEPHAQLESQAGALREMGACASSSYCAASASCLHARALAVQQPPREIDRYELPASARSHIGLPDTAQQHALLQRVASALLL
jgi:hypothetical protein